MPKSGLLNQNDSESEDEAEKLLKIYNLVMIVNPA